MTTTATRATSADDLRARFARIFELISAGDVDGLGEVLHRDVVDHRRVLGQGDGLPGMGYWVRSIREVMPDLTATVEDTLVEGAKVAGRVLFTGTPDGTRFAPAPTDHWIEVEFLVIVRFEDDLVVEWWDASDTAEVLRNLGVRFEAPEGVEPGSPTA